MESRIAICMLFLTISSASKSFIVIHYRSSSTDYWIEHFPGSSPLFVSHAGIPKHDSVVVLLV